MAVPNASRQGPNGRPSRVLCPSCLSFETMCGWEHKGTSFYLCRDCDCTWSVCERSDLVLSEVIAALNLVWRNPAPTPDIDITEEHDAECASGPYIWLVNRPVSKPN